MTSGNDTTGRTATSGGDPPAEARKRLLAGTGVVERRLDLGDISTAVLEGGEGPPIVLLHGPGGNATHWHRVLPDLVANRRVIAPDLPGQGATEVTGAPLDADRVLDWLLDLIGRTCASPPTLVGFALGGAIAARFAADHRSRNRTDSSAGSARSGGSADTGASGSDPRLDRLVLVDALGLVPFDPAPDFGVALNDFLSQPTPGSHDRLWQHCALDLDTLQSRLGGHWDDFRAYNVDRAQTPSVQSSLRALMAAFGGPAIPAEDLARISVPTTLVWGREDLATPLHVAQAVSERYGWPLHVIDDCGDDPAVEAPEKFLGALRSALAAPSVVRSA
ncbi:alpha/beta hydrolase [Actinopolymorpha sp. B11F2]|uniref:alpha/beta fold hydrolase n=1 Tax=Actinopolymorpha sp. B11F2 TaxID=3160862 RepID=UPI0032E480DC